MEKWRKYIFAGVAVLCLAVAGWLLYPLVLGGDGQAPAGTNTPAATAGQTAKPEGASAQPATPTESGAMRLLKVSIQGNVMYPGEYYLAPGSTVAEAIEMAGGLLEGADTEKLDLGAAVYENQYIGIP